MGIYKPLFGQPFIREPAENSLVLLDALSQI
jgi:hypothetical protein